MDGKVTRGCRRFRFFGRAPRGYEVRVHLHAEEDCIGVFCGDTHGAPVIVRTLSPQIHARDARNG